MPHDLSTSPRVSPKRFNLEGRRFERLLVVARSTKINKTWFWSCECDCGNRKDVGQVVLLTGRTRSCGCLREEATRERSTTHGLCKGRKPPEFGIWATMRNRCSNPTVKSYPDYGGRGIKVCVRWADSFANFIEDMGFRPSPSHTIDRIDNDGDYEPGNCRWTDRKTQTRNTRRNHHLEYKGETKTIAEWAELRGMRQGTLNARLTYGWDVAKAIETPVQGKRGQARAASIRPSDPEEHIG